MTRRKSDITRPDKRIGARIETLAYLFDVSVQTVLNAVAKGAIKPSAEVFGVKLYHVPSVERAIFGEYAFHEAEMPEAAAPDDPPAARDPYLEGINAAQKVHRIRPAS